MDLGAYVISQETAIVSYVNKHYGDVPRLRGVRFMRVETPYHSDSYQNDMFDSYCGKDIIYIHTRCGGNNYIDCGGEEWENSNPLFLEGVDDEWDCTYRDHYFEAVVDEEYNKIIAMLSVDID